VQLFNIMGCMYVIFHFFLCVCVWLFVVTVVAVWTATSSRRIEETEQNRQVAEAIF
jgi:uncharacterized membrane protein